jgi:hypothetical protein
MLGQRSRNRALPGGCRVNDQTVSGVPWSNVITAATALGVVGLTGLYNDRARRIDQRRTAYASLVQAAGDLLDHHRKSPPDDETAGREFNHRIGDLLGELHRAVAVVELAGSAKAAGRAKLVYEKAQGKVSARWTPDDDRGSWIMTLFGAGDVAFEKEIEAFTDAVRPELNRRWPSGFSALPRRP